MKRVILFLTLVFTCPFAFSQNMGFTRVTKEKTVVKYDDDHTHAIINGVKTSNNILGLFKPDEVSLRRVHSENVSMHVLVLGIDVKDNTHPVLKYFEHKAKLYLNGRFYDHNVIPAIEAAQVSSLVFHVATDTTENYLEVKLFGKDHVPNQKYKYRTAPERARYFDVNGEIMETSAMAKLGLQRETFTSKTLCCKEAYEKYNDLRFVEGIEVIRTK